MPPPGRVLVYKKEKWYCLKCGEQLQDCVTDKRYIQCATKTCERYRWQLLRPDMATAEVVGAPQDSLTSETAQTPNSSSPETLPESKSSSPSELLTVDTVLKRHRAGSADASS
jgi:hypothetical protein